MSEPSGRVAGAVLAAGLGRRMGQPKAEIVVAGGRLLDRAVAVLFDGGCAPVYAVVQNGVDAGAAEAVVNPDPARGQRSSLDLAVDAAERDGVDALAVLLVDTPGVGAAAVGTVLSAWRAGRITVATYDGRRGHPVVMSVALWRTAVGLAGPDEGARALMARRADAVDVVAVDGDPVDLDEPADLERWLGRHSS